MADKKKEAVQSRPTLDGYVIVKARYNQDLNELVRTGNRAEVMTWVYKHITLGELSCYDYKTQIDMKYIKKAVGESNTIPAGKIIGD